MKTTLTTLLLIITLSVSAQQRVVSLYNELYDDVTQTVLEKKYEKVVFRLDLKYSEVIITDGEFKDKVLDIQSIEIADSTEYTIYCMDITNDNVYILTIDKIKNEISMMVNTNIKQIRTYICREVF